MPNKVERDHSVLSRVGLPLLGFAIAIAVWWLVTVIFHIRTFLVPSPPDVVSSLHQQHTLLLQSAWITLKETLLGFAIGAVAALVLALLLTAFRVVEQTAMPVMVAVNSIPKLSVAPLLVIWLGFGQLPKVVMVVLLCFFPILLSCVTGLTSTPSDFGELARALSAPKWKTFLKVRLPWAMPQIFVGLKVAVSLSVIGAVVAEYVSSTEGLGNIILNTSASGDTSLAFASVFLLTVESVVLYYLITGVERVALPWARETSS
jgi:NitT/TauT family transport system permease protein